MDELKNKVALVVGAGVDGDEGIGNGRATAITFAREGAQVVCADIDESSAEHTAQLIRDEGHAASAVAFDVTDLAQVERAVDSVIDAHGRIDVLDNNVGIGVVGGVTDLDPADWERVMRVNVTGAFNTMRHVIPHMAEAGGGSIVNISSLAGVRWMGYAAASYYTSKAALNHLTRTTAAEFAARNVRVNAILPGLIKTPMVTNVAGLTDAYDSADTEELWRERERRVPMGRMGQAWDVANAALFLASDRSAYVTGVELRVDGGITLVSGR
ncbi:SDR family NAD(P)-dependent oxidoreductase [Streptomyces sp. H23]|uniref:SDR family NAD(P)-dependent oxidoreductase n=1 Tax=Streptomyces TaxID=1883 RepID=UPI00106EADA9|nr:SDR family NAD(P)-dependent oxidoreductase [Streptomyces sp. H23]